MLQYSNRQAWGLPTNQRKALLMAEAKTPRVRSITRLFVNDDGKVTARATETTHTVVFKFADDSETRFDLKRIGVDTSKPSVARAAAAFGVSTSAGNAGNTAAAAQETDDPEAVREAVEDRLDVFAPEDGSPGEWSAEREAGAPRTSMLLEALAALRKEKGADTSPEKMAAFRAKFADKDYAKQQMAYPPFRAHYEKIKAAKAAERAAKAANAAQGVQADAGDLLQ